MTARHISAGALMLILGACTAREAGDSRPILRGPVRAHVLDSAKVRDWEDSVVNDDIVVYRVEVSAGPWSDTLERVLDTVRPSNDSVVSGLMIDSATRDRILFRARSGGPGVETLPLARGNDWHFHDVAISPDARHVIFLLQRSPGLEFPVVRAWGSDADVWAGPDRPGCECDTDPHHARWVTRDSFEFAGRLDQRRWERFSGVVTSRRVHVDTLPDTPRWH